MGADDQTQIQSVTANLAENERLLRAALKDCADVQFRRVPFQGALRVLQVGMDGLAAVVQVAQVGTAVGAADRPLRPRVGGLAGSTLVNLHLQGKQEEKPAICLE